MNGVNTGASSNGAAASAGGGGRLSTGFCSKVVGAIVTSSYTRRSDTTGTAGRWIASGGGGTSISGGRSIAAIS